MIIGKKNFDVAHHTYIFGILNVTPDSFSDGGKFNELDAALRHAARMIEEGADVLDIGGESTRPGHTIIGAAEEIARVVPVIEAVKARFDIPISVDTYKSEVARAAIAAGADLVNDVWGLKYDPEMARLIAESGVACCLMHNRHDREYSDFLADFGRDMAESVKLAEDAGIAREKVILDPGIGFAKNLQQNLEAIRRADVLKKTGLPLLLGTSRKSFIGKILDCEKDDRLEGTLATTAWAVMSGYAFVRVHDVKENKRTVAMTEAILQAQLA